MSVDPVKALVVDPNERTVTEHTIMRQSMVLYDLHRLIGSSILDQGRLNAERDQVWVDDTGLLDGKTRWFVATKSTPFAGRAVVIGCDDFGEVRDVQITRDELLAMITWGEG